MKNKKNLLDLTFLLPFRQDSLDRLENIMLITEYFLENFKTNIKILECAPYCNKILQKVLNKNIQYDYYEDNDPIFYRSVYLNKMVRECNTSFISLWDVDAIAPVNQIIKSMELLRNGETNFIYPYENKLLDTSPILRKLYIQNRSIDFLIKHQKKMKEMYPPNPIGGGFLANRKAYIEIGNENKSFYGRDLENRERYCHQINSGDIIKRVEGPMFHLTHHRGLNSNFQNKDLLFIKRS